MSIPLLSRSDSGKDEEQGSPPPGLTTSLRKVSSYEDLVLEHTALHAPIAVTPTSRAALVCEKVQYLRSQLLLLDGHLVIALLAWYLVGLFAIVTTKLLLMEWQVPPLLLTFQQFVVASNLLKLRLCCSRDGIAPWPWQADHKQLHGSASLVGNGSETPTTTSVPPGSMDFLLTGLFNSLDLLASNAAFSTSAASFVETIKSCDPITTASVALIWNVDRLESDEGICLFVLVMGMLLSTWGNSAAEDSSMSLAESTQAAATVMTANVCFAFRAMSQKLYRRHATTDQMSDENLLAKMFQIGWIALGPICLLFYTGHVYDALQAPLDLQMQYAKLASVNAVAFATYKYVLNGQYVVVDSSLCASFTYPHLVC